MKQVNERRILCYLRKSDEKVNTFARPDPVINMTILPWKFYYTDDSVNDNSTKYERINKHKEA